MTVEKVKAEVARIATLAGDDEEAHTAEDKLHYDVIEAIAARKTDDPRGIALEALQTRNIKFSRWCA